MWAITKVYSAQTKQWVDLHMWVDCRNSQRNYMGSFSRVHQDNACVLIIQDSFGMVVYLMGAPSAT